MLLVRVDESGLAPHEFTEEAGRFLVRRGTEIGGLTLREMEAMLRRRDAISMATRALAPMINFDTAAPGPDFIGIRLEPDRASPHVLRLGEQQQIVEMVETLADLQDLAPETQADGVLFRSREQIQGQDDNPERRLRRCYISSEGAIEMRFPIRPGTNLLYQIFVALGDAFALSSWLLRLLGQGPVVHGKLFFRYNARTAHHGPFKLPDVGDTVLTIDFARTAFVDAFTERVLYLARWGGTPLNDDDIRPALERFWREGLGSRDVFSPAAWFA
jgi:hypothetical protein